MILLLLQDRDRKARELEDTKLFAEAIRTELQKQEEENHKLRVATCSNDST